MVDEMTILAICRLCGDHHDVVVGTMDYALWKGGAHIQEAMPYLTADQREILISGTCGACFDRMFGEVEV